MKRGNINMLGLFSKNNSYNLVEGTIKETNTWTETNVSGGGGSTVMMGGWGYGSQKGVRSVTHNFLEFWVQMENGHERCYKVNANKVKIRPDQSVKIIEIANDKNHEALLVYNQSDDRLYKAGGAWAMWFFNEKILTTLLLLFSCFGLMLCLTSAGRMVYFPVMFLLVLPYTIFALCRYGAKLKSLKKTLLNEKSSHSEDTQTPVFKPVAVG